MARERHPRESHACARALLGAALLGAAILFVPAASAPAAESGEVAGAPASGWSSLLAPEPRGFDRGTALRLGRLLRSLPEEGPRLGAQIVARGRQVGAAASALLLLFIAVMGVAVGLQGWRWRWVEAKALPGLRQVSAPLRPWIAALAQISAAALPPLVLVILHELVRRVTGFTGTGFLLLAIGLRAWFVWALVTASLRELLLRPLLPVTAEHGRYLFRVAWWLASAGLVLSALLEIAARAGAASDLLALLAALLELALILLVATFATHKQALLGLLPLAPSPKGTPQRGDDADRRGRRAAGRIVHGR